MVSGEMKLEEMKKIGDCIWIKSKRNTKRKI